MGARFEQLCAKPSCDVATASVRVPDQPGYYTIYVNDSAVLPDPFRKVLDEQSQRLIYIGIATRSLRKRLFEEDLRHQRPSTFFRGIGAICGYRPPKGSLRNRKNQYNYSFSTDDTEKLRCWICSHLSVSWVEVSRPRSCIEKFLIQKHCPLLNKSHNPNASPDVANCRRECREIATRSPCDD